MILNTQGYFRRHSIQVVHSYRISFVVIRYEGGVVDLDDCMSSRTVDICKVRGVGLSEPEDVAYKSM